MEYQTAIRGAFFDIAQVCDSADAIAQHARYLEDGLLFIQNGKILAPFLLSFFTPLRKH